MQKKIIICLDFGFLLSFEIWGFVVTFCLDAKKAEEKKRLNLMQVNIGKPNRKTFLYFVFVLLVFLNFLCLISIRGSYDCFLSLFDW